MNDNTLIADIEGYASIFHERDLNGDIMAPGAFAASLKKSEPVRMLYQHAAETPIGRWTALREDRRGLFIRGEILLSSPKAREVHALVKGGAIDGLSIGYQTVRARKEKAARRILEASLWEVSIVTFPMAKHARITFVGDPRPHSTLDTGRNFSPTPAFPSRADDPLRPARRASALPPAGARHPDRATNIDPKEFASALRCAADVLTPTP